MMLYRFVDQQKAEGFPIERVCDVAGVSRSAYYDWKQHRDGISTIAELEERRLVKEIEDIWDESDGTYGSPRVIIELGKRGWAVNHKRVERPDADPRPFRIHPEEASHHDDPRRWTSDSGPGRTGLHPHRS